MGKSQRTPHLVNEVSGRTIWDKTTFELSHEVTSFASISQNGSEWKAIKLVAMQIYILFPELFNINIYTTFRKSVAFDH